VTTNATAVAVPVQKADLDSRTQDACIRVRDVNRIRAALCAASVAIAAAQAPLARAEVYRPWCVQYLGGYSGGTSCTFHSFEQCMETARGNGATCVQNPWYLRYGRGGDAAEARRPRRR